MAIEFQKSSNLGNLFNELDKIGQRGAYTVKPKLPAPPKPRALQPFQGLGSNAGLGSMGTGDTGVIGGVLGRLRGAIRSQESGGRYSAVNRYSGASGAYQILKSNFAGPGGWDKEALGHDVSYSEFMHSPAIQDAIATYKLRQYLNHYGPAGAAVAWYGGPGAVKNMYSHTTQAHGYPSLYAYWTSVLSKMR